MKIIQSWKRNTPTTDGYSLTVTYIYSSKYLHEIEEVESKLPRGILVMDTDKSERMYPLEQDVEPEQKRGKWMHDKDDALHAGYCSCCGWMANIAETDVADMPFCPNCGAMMEGSEDND